MVLRFWVGDRHQGSTPLISNLLVAYEAHQGLVPSRSSYTDIDESVVMLTLNSLASRRQTINTIFKVFGVTRTRESNPGSPVPYAGALPRYQGR